MMDFQGKDDEFHFGSSKPYSIAYSRKVLFRDLVYFKVLSSGIAGS